MSNNGYIYSIVTLLMSLLLLGAISLYHDSYKYSAESNPSRIRTDELHCFVESTKKDIGRAMVISGRRATIYSVDYAINPPGNPLINYSFNCTEECGVDCGGFLPPDNGSEAAIAELILCGTRFGVNVTEMENHTLGVWVDKVIESGDGSGFDVNISISAMDMYPYDSWRFLEVITLTFNVSDKGGSCKYSRSDVMIYSLVSLIDLEDPLYPLRTSNRIRRYFIEGNRTGDVEILATGTNGNGMGGGKIFDVSSGTAGEQETNITNYTSTYPQLVEYTVFVIDIADFEGDLSNDVRRVLNMSGGVIYYPNQNLNDQEFPYVSGVAPALNFSNISYVALRNTGGHEILRLLINDDIGSGVYYSSGNGSCFFDRLDGTLNLSEKYVNQSEEIVGLLGMDTDTKIGMESFVNVSTFADYMLYSSGILPPFTNQSSVDYLYFQNISGKRVYGTPAWFRLDDEHCVNYNLTAFCHT